MIDPVNVLGNVQHIDFNAIELAEITEQARQEFKQPELIMPEVEVSMTEEQQEDFVVTNFPLQVNYLLQLAKKNAEVGQNEAKLTLRAPMTARPAVHDLSTAIRNYFWRNGFTTYDPDYKRGNIVFEKYTDLDAQKDVTLAVKNLVVCWEDITPKDVKTIIQSRNSDVPLY
jgi:hypothetical protein